MIKEQFKYPFKGEVTFKLIKGDKVIKEWTKPNAIQVGAQVMVANLLTGDRTFRITTIEAFKAGFSLAVAPIYNWTFPAPNEVAFTATFDEASFNDTLDELRLQASFVPIDFSIINGLSITKDDLTRLAITWKITINNLP
jgi:hypothetical protein